MKGKAVTVGWRYHLGIHMVVSQGPVDAVTGIKVGESTLWEGNITASATLSVNKPELFGGDKRQGGVIGDIDLAFGEASQAPNAYLQGVQGSPIPAYRGVMSFILKQIYLAANNPYIKPWAFRIKRLPAKTWYPEKAGVGGDANPAHIIYECLTSDRWGLGYTGGNLDDAAFRAAADTLHTENFGLSLVLADQTSVKAFIDTVLNHIDGALYLDQTTGKFTLKLVRNDYNPATLPVLGPSNIVRMDSFSRPGIADLVNQVTLIYQERDSDKKISVTIQDLGLIAMQQGVVPTTIQYLGIANATLANNVAMRELKTLTQPLARLKLIANRESFDLKPGSVFKFTWPDLGIVEMVMRIATMDFGTLTDGEVTIDAVEDVFFSVQSVFADPPPTLWTDPIGDPVPVVDYFLLTAPYWLIATQFLGDNSSAIDGIDVTSAFMLGGARRVGSGAASYEFWTSTNNADDSNDQPGSPTSVFTPTATLSAAISETTTTLALTGAIDINQVVSNTIALIGGELVYLTNAPSTSSVTVVRGILHTLPKAHALGTRIWFFQDFFGHSEVEFASSITMYAKFLTETGKGVLPKASDTWKALLLNQSWGAPYPPGMVTVNSVLRATSIAGVNTTATIQWYHRDRSNTAAVNIGNDQATNVGPETGSTITIQVYSLKVGGSLVKTYSGLTGTTFTYTANQAFIDNGNIAFTERRLEIFTVRDGLNSVERHVIPLDWTVNA
jgi:hypothetical protein